MNRYVKLEDIRDAIKDLNSRVFLDGRTAMPIIETIVGLPTIELSDDCISRADLLLELRKDIESVDIAEYVNDTIWRAIEDAPSVMPSGAKMKGTKRCQ